MNFKISKTISNIIFIFKTSIYLLFAIPLFYLLQFALLVFEKTDNNASLFTSILVYIVFLAIILVLLSPILKHLKYIQEKGFISTDEKAIIFILFLRKLSLTYSP